MLSSSLSTNTGEAQQADKRQDRWAGETARSFPTLRRNEDSRITQERRGKPLGVQNENVENRKEKRKSKHLCSSLDANIC